MAHDDRCPAPVGGAPPHERLRRHHPAVGEVDDRLELDLEAPLVDRGPQAGHEVEAHVNGEGGIARTPNIDALAAGGINYVRAHPQNVVCMPSRSTMVTGQHVSTHGVWMNGVPLPEDAPSIAATLRTAGYRTALLGKAHFEPFLDVFGRPARNSACECERVSAPALGQTLALVSSNDLQQKLMMPNGYVDKLASAGPEYRERVRSIFQRVFARPPRDSELQTAVAFLESQSDVKEGYRSLLWALLATNEFLFNH